MIMEAGEDQEKEPENIAAEKLAARNPSISDEKVLPWKLNLVKLVGLSDINLDMVDSEAKDIAEYCLPLVVHFYGQTSSIAENVSGALYCQVIHFHTAIVINFVCYISKTVLVLEITSNICASFN